MEGRRSGPPRGDFQNVASDCLPVSSSHPPPQLFLPALIMCSRGPDTHAHYFGSFENGKVVLDDQLQPLPLPCRELSQLLLQPNLNAVVPDGRFSIECLRNLA